MKKGYVFLDIEATGLDINKADIIQFSAIIMNEDFNIKGFINKFFWTDLEIEKGAEKVHRITKDILMIKSKKQRLVDSANTLVGLLKDFVVIGHNVEFDINMIINNLKRHCSYELDKNNIEYICTMRRYVDLTAIPMIRKSSESSKSNSYTYKMPSLKELITYVLNKSNKTMETLIDYYKQLFNEKGNFHDAFFDCFCTYYCFIYLK